jgi:hypothetical protein
MHDNPFFVNGRSIVTALEAKGGEYLNIYCFPMPARGVKVYSMLIQRKDLP